MNKYDRRRKYYLILDCETATLPIAANYDETARKNIAIAKPLIYDIGWTMVDRQGRVYARKNYLISEIFSVPSIFNTAYYAEKRPIYLEKLRKGEIILTDWRSAMAELIEDLDAAESVGAYNSMFDYKKAIPFTELYINKLYSADFHDWLKLQNEICEEIAGGSRSNSSKTFEPDIFRFRGSEYRLFDLWGLACRHILNSDDYRDMCDDNGWFTASGKYYKTSAETAYAFITGQTDFVEAHTAIDDADIESEIFAAITKATKNKWEIGIIYFPFRMVGKVE